MTNKMGYAMGLVLVPFSLTAPAVAIPPIHVSVVPSGAGTHGDFENGSDITLESSYSGSSPPMVTWTISTDSTANSIGNIAIIATGTSPAAITIVGPTINSAVASIDSISSAGSTAEVELTLVRTATVGNVLASTIVGMYVTGNANGTITCTPRSGGNPSHIVSAFAGGFRGNISVEEGYISQLYSSGGTIGVAGTPIQIVARSRIEHIFGTAIYADISVLADGSGAADVHRIVTGDGPFVGSLTARKFDLVNGSGFGGPGIFINHVTSMLDADLDADIIFTDSFDTNITGQVHPQISVPTGYALKQGRTIRIGDGLIGSSSSVGTIYGISLPANGLKGQIIINANNGSGGWTAPVKVDGYTLDESSGGSDDAPYYERLSSDLGGGAVGLVPFHLHDEDCTPPNFSSQCSIGEYEDNDYRETIVLRHYGPVGVASTPALKIERTDAVCGSPPCTWTDVTNDFDVIPPGTSPNTTKRDVWVSPVNSGTFGIEYAYRITVRKDGSVTRLRSLQTLAGSDPNVDEWTYQVLLLCMDLTTSGDIESGDIVAWYDTPTDFNRDAAADSTDLEMLVDRVVNGGG